MTKNQHRLIPASEKTEAVDTERASAEELAEVADTAEAPVEAQAEELAKVAEEMTENTEIVLAETGKDVEEPETNQWLVDSPIDHCPVCRDHWRTDLRGQPSCTSEPPLPHCPLFLS